MAQLHEQGREVRPGPRAEAAGRTRRGAGRRPSPTEGLRELVWEVLVKQLGHRPSEASQLIADAFKRRPDMTTPEELFDEIYRGRDGAAVSPA